MDSREILPGTETVRFLLDTETLDPLVSRDRSNETNFLHYHEYDSFDYIRTPAQTDSELLQNINSYQREVEGHENRQVIRWGADTQTVLGGRYLPSLYERLAAEVEWKEPAVSVDDLEFVDLFNEMVQPRDRCVDILVTASPSILENRRLLEYEFRRHRRGRMHIMTPKEAGEVAGIYMRRNNDFIFYNHGDSGSTYTIDFTLWYWRLPRVFIHHFTFNGEGYLESMFDRFESLFICIDKLGEQYLSGTGNLTDLMTRYHFNNGISLLTGICDILALHTREKYGIKIPDRNTNLRVGGHPLLKELRICNKEAWQHVQNNHEIIELLHTVRNDVIHQSGVIKRGPGFSLREHDEIIEWESQSIGMDTLDKEDREKFRKYYEGLDDSVEEFDPVTKWGVVTISDEYPEISRHTQIEPYRFLKQSTKEITEFTDEYLRLLGHPNRLHASPETEAEWIYHVRMISERGLFPLIEENQFELDL